MPSYAHYIVRGMAMAGRVARLGQGHITADHGLSGYFYMLAHAARVASTTQSWKRPRG